MAKPIRVASDIHSPVQDHPEQPVEHDVDHDVWFRQKVAGSLDQLNRGEFLTHEEVGARLKKMPQPG
jgi:predicted transcriptional regulator